MGADIIIICILSLVIGKFFRKSQSEPSFAVPLIGIIVHNITVQAIIASGFNLKYIKFLQAIFILIILIYKFRINKKNEQILSDNLGV